MIGAARGPVLEVYADIWCPFAHVGLRWMASRLDQLARDAPDIVVRAWPLELVNGHPQDAEATRRHVEALRSQVAPSLFSNFDPGHFPDSTLSALALAASAYRRDVRTGWRVSLELRDLLFEHGLDISDQRVLDRVATEHRLSPGAADRLVVLDEWHTGQERGVLGSPHFFCGTDGVFCPSLDVAHDDAGAAIVRDRFDRLADFVDRCASSASH